MQHLAGGAHEHTVVLRLRRVLWSRTDFRRFMAPCWGRKEAVLEFWSGRRVQAVG